MCSMKSRLQCIPICSSYDASMPHRSKQSKPHTSSRGVGAGRAVARGVGAGRAAARASRLLGRLGLQGFRCLLLLAACGSLLWQMSQGASNTCSQAQEMAGKVFMVPKIPGCCSQVRGVSSTCTSARHGCKGFGGELQGLEVTLSCRWATGEQGSWAPSKEHLRLAARPHMMQ